MALGITWILDGLEVTLAGSVAPALQESPVLRLDAADVGASASIYLLGGISGALFFGWLTDRLGPQAPVQHHARALSAGDGGDRRCPGASASFALFRFLTGAGIGGEGTAINSAIQELIPARFRGWTDLTINGSFWVGAALGAAGVHRAARSHPAAAGLGLARGVRHRRGARARHPVPAALRAGEPALARHSRPAAEANRVIEEIETRVVAATGCPLPAATGRIRLSGRGHATLAAVARTLVATHRQRTVLGLVLITSQAFFYNAIFFTYALILTRFYDIPAASIGHYMLPFALGNFCGPLLLGRLFDTIGRKTMIAGTYALSGILLAVTAFLFGRGGSMRRRRRSAGR